MEDKQHTVESVLEILQNEFNYTNRGVRENMGCAYYVPETGNMCIIGKCLGEENAKWLVKKGHTFGVAYFKTNWEKLKFTFPNYKLGQFANLNDLFVNKPEFLREMQSFHDNHLYWNENWKKEGDEIFTEYGKRKLETIKKIYKIS